MCDRPYNVYTGTLFQQRHLTPRQVVLLMRGICKGEPSTTRSAELEIGYQTVLEMRHAVQKLRYSLNIIQENGILPGYCTEWWTKGMKVRK